MGRRSLFVVLIAGGAWRLVACQIVGGIDEFKPAVEGGTGPVADGLGRPCLRDDQCPEHLCLRVGLPADVDAGSSVDGGDAGDVPLTGNVCTTQCATQADCVAGWTCDHQVGLEINICRCTATPEQCDGKDNDCNGKVDEDFDLATDPNHCGKCDVSCAVGAACVAGQCTCGQSTSCTNDPKIETTCAAATCQKVTTIATGQASATDVTSDGTTVAWLVNADDGGDPPTSNYSVLAALASGGGAVQTLVARSTRALGLVQEGGVFYWAESPGGVQSCRTTGCGGAPTRLIADDAVLALRVGGPTIVMLLPSALKTCPMTGCTSGNQVASLSPTNGILAIDEAAAYVPTQTLQRIALPSGPASTLFPMNPAATAIDVDRDNVYWATSGQPNKIRWCPKTGCGPDGKQVKDLTALGGSPMIAFGGKVYFRRQLDPALVWCPATGCGEAPTVVMKGDVRSLAADSTSVYFLLNDGVYRLTE